MSRVIKIVPFLKGENLQQAVQRLKQFHCRFCCIAEIYQYWQEHLVECIRYKAIVCLQEESFFNKQVACTWCSGPLSSPNVYIEFSTVVDEKHGILVEVDPWLL